jgi:hypothetical protein
MKIKLSLLFLLSSYQLNIPRNQSQYIPQSQNEVTVDQQLQQEGSVNNASSNQQQNSTISKNKLQQWWNGLSSQQQKKLKIGAGIVGLVVTEEILRKLYRVYQMKEMRELKNSHARLLNDKARFEKTMNVYLKSMNDEISRHNERQKIEKFDINKDHLLGRIKREGPQNNQDLKGYIDTMQKYYKTLQENKKSSLQEQKTENEEDIKTAVEGINSIMDKFHEDSKIPAVTSENYYTFSNQINNSGYGAGGKFNLNINKKDAYEKAKYELGNIQSKISEYDRRIKEYEKTYPPIKE